MDILEGLDANMLALEVLLDGHRPSSLPEERDGFAADPNADRSKRTGQGVRTRIQALLDDKIFQAMAEAGIRIGDLDKLLGKGADGALGILADLSVRFHGMIDGEARSGQVLQTAHQVGLLTAVTDRVASPTDRLLAGGDPMAHQHFFLVEALDVDQAPGARNRETIEELAHDLQGALEPRGLHLRWQSRRGDKVLVESLTEPG